MIIDAISDLHGHYPQLEGGALLIVAGDCLKRETIAEKEIFFDWLADQNYKNKILVGGNHDNFLIGCMAFNEEDDFDYLCDSGTEFTFLDLAKDGVTIIRNKLKIWGSPWTAGFKGMNPHCMAFTMSYGCDTEDWLDEKFSLIPDDTDILITHSPPLYLLDECHDYQAGKIVNVGSYALRKAIERVKPKIHIFGHIHENNGKMVRLKHSCDVKPYTDCYNVSIVDERYRPKNKATRIIL